MATKPAAKPDLGAALLAAVRDAESARLKRDDLKIALVQAEKNLSSALGREQIARNTFTGAGFDA